MTTRHVIALLASWGLTTGVKPCEAQQEQRIVYSKTAFGASISRHVLTVPDTANHTLSTSFRIDGGQTNRTDFVVLQEHVYAQSEAVGERRSSRGYSVFLMASGDSVFLSWRSDSIPIGGRADGEKATGSGTAVVTGGTGKFRRLRGTGDYRSFAKGPVIEEVILKVTGLAR